MREGSEYVRVEWQKRREARNKRRELPHSTTCVGSHAPCFRSAVKVAAGCRCGDGVAGRSQ